MMAEADKRAAVQAAALGWLGTPFHDNACVKGAGVDCAMLIKSSFEEAGVITPADVAQYSAQWALHQNDQLFLAEVLKHAIEIDESSAKPGDIVLYKFGRCLSHGAIVIEPGWPQIVHAFKQEYLVTTGRGDAGILGFEALKGVTRPRERRFYTMQAWG